MMGVDDPKTWVPYMNTKDCSLGICSIYCPQWCYVVFPPPATPVSSNDDSGVHLSPLVIAIISILVSALLIVSYYAILSKFCRNVETERRGNLEHINPGENNNNHDGSSDEPWFVNSNGLDESVIKSITSCKYRRGDGLIESADCCVCLGEFKEDETLRLLPKCSHAFHVNCIDTWLKSHSNCPLCRATVVSPCVQPIDSYAPQTNDPVNHESSSGDEPEDYQTLRDGIEVGAREERLSLHIENQRKNDCEVDSSRDVIVEIIDGEHMVRRSVSMDHSWPSRIDIADILGEKEEQGCRMEECSLHAHSISSNGEPCSSSSSSSTSRALDPVASAFAMRRSVSSGRFLFTWNGRALNVVVPV